MHIIALVIYGRCMNMNCETIIYLKWSCFFASVSLDNVNMNLIGDC